jgi:hypothetical protein
MPSFLVTWNDPAHRTDRGCFMLFKSLQAPYDVLEWTVSMLEKVFLRRLGCFDLIVRSSLATRTALKSFADIDVDLILPRFLCSYESISADCKGDDI